MDNLRNNVSFNNAHEGIAGGGAVASSGNFEPNEFGKFFLGANGSPFGTYAKVISLLGQETLVSLSQALPRGVEQSTTGRTEIECMFNVNLLCTGQKIN